MGNPVASPFVVLDLVPIVMFEVELNGEICAFEKDKGNVTVLPSELFVHLSLTDDDKEQDEECL